MATRAATDEASPFVFYDWQYAILFGPLALGFLSSIFGGNLRQSGNHVRVRPPPWVFFVVWTMLYTLLGVAWAMNISYWNETKLQNVNLWTAYGINLTGNEMFIMCMCFYSFLMFCLFIWPEARRCWRNGCLRSWPGSSFFVRPTRGKPANFEYLHCSSHRLVRIRHAFGVS